MPRSATAYILGDIFGVTDVIGAELLAITRRGFRQRLARARRDLRSFMDEKCGLVNTANPCRCAKKTRGFVASGHVDPERLLFAEEGLVRVREVATRAQTELSRLDEAYAEIHRDHPFHSSPDFVEALRGTLRRADLQTTWELVPRTRGEPS